MNVYKLFQANLTARFFAIITLFSLVLSAFPAAFFVAEAATETIFEDSFEATPPLSGWDISDSLWTTNANDARTGTKQAEVNGSGSGDQTLQEGIDTTGYENISLSFWYKIEGLDDGDSITVEWYDGSSWNPVTTILGVDTDSDDSSDWIEVTDNLGSGANDNSDFAVRFVSSLNAGNDKFNLEDIVLEGDTLPEPKTETEIDVYGDTSAGENQPGWLFNRDASTATPFEFNTDESVIGDGALYVEPITNTYDGSFTPPGCTSGVGCDKFIAEFFYLDDMDVLESFSYDFKIGAGGDSSDKDHFYLNVYANYPGTAVDNFYQCRYNVIPTSGSVSGFTTVTFDPFSSYSVATRSGSPTCPSTPADMGSGATIRAFAINLGDTSLNDTDLDGYFDNVVIETQTEITTYDFEPGKDTQKPVHEVLSPADNYYADGNFFIEVKSTDNEGLDKVVINLKDEFGGHLGTCLNVAVGGVLSTTTGCVMDISGLADGTYQFRTNATDLSGNISNTISQTFYVGKKPEQCINLLENGSFEEPIVNHSNLWSKFSIVAGWTIEKVIDSSPTTLELHRGWSSNEAADGDQYVELDGDHSTKISQSVTTIPGGIYELSWAFAPRHAITAEQNQLSVLIDGDEVATEGPATHAADLVPDDWKQSSHSFEADGETTIITFADAGPSNSYGTFLDDARLCLVEEPEPQMCSITMESDTNTVILESNEYAVETYSDHPSWTASIFGAEWIWETFFVEDPQSDTTRSFVETFIVDDVKDATLTVSADNSYKIYINDVLAYEESDESNFLSSQQNTYTDVADYIHDGENTFKMVVKNWAQSGGTAKSNPAGALYKLAVNAVSECEVTTEVDDNPYGPYCGDGIKNQGWEMCDGTDGLEEGQSCTDYCTLDNQCSAEQLVKITLTEAPESESFDGMIYLGAAGNIIPNGTWFNFAELGDNTVNSIANNADGLAVERTGSQLRLAIKGGNAKKHYDYAFGNIETKGIELGTIDRSPITGWPLENSGTYKDIFNKDTQTQSVDFKFYLTTGDDAVAVDVAQGEEYDCEECKAEVEARVVIRDEDGAEINTNGLGNLLPQVILGDDTVVPFGEWFKLSTGGTSTVNWIDDPKTVTNYSNPKDLEGLFVSREGNGEVKVALYGFHNPGGNTNFESLRATIEFNDAGVTSVKQIPSDFVLENHSENDAVESNDDFDSFAKHTSSVDFDFWVDTKADGITITLDDDSVAMCEDDSEPEDPEEVDYCPYVDGVQAIDEDCPEPEVDVCPDDEGIQTSEDECSVPEVDMCPDVDGIQTSTEECSQQEIDYCPDLDGIQSSEDSCSQPEITTTSSGGGNTGTRIRSLLPTPLVLGASTDMCPFLTEFMQIGADNSSWEVTKLQIFLNLFKDTYGGVTNPITGIFDTTTDANVKAFQLHYQSEILTPWFERGIVPHNRPTGFVYKTTLWKINSIVCPDDAIEPDFEGEDLSKNVDLD